MMTHACVADGVSMNNSARSVPIVTYNIFHYSRILH